VGRPQRNKRFGRRRDPSPPSDVCDEPIRALSDL
jgi:hypothetical protein